MIIFTNVRKSIDYTVFILRNVHPSGNDQIEPYNMKINSLQRFFHPECPPRPKSYGEFRAIFFAL